MYTNAMSANFRQLRIDNKMTDIIIAVENKQIPAHRLLLASGSKYFHNLFESLNTSIGNPTIGKCTSKWTMGHSTQFRRFLHFIYVVALTGMSYAEVMLVIDFIYAGQVDVPKTNWSSFVKALKLLEVNGYENVGDIDPRDIENDFKMRNCYVKLTEISIPQAESHAESDAPATSPSVSSPPLRPDPSVTASSPMSARSSSVAVPESPSGLDNISLRYPAGLQNSRARNPDMPDLEGSNCLPPRKTHGRQGDDTLGSVLPPNKRRCLVSLTDSDHDDRPLTRLRGKLHRK